MSPCAVPAAGAPAPQGSAPLLRPAAPQGPTGRGILLPHTRGGGQQRGHAQDGSPGSARSARIPRSIAALPPPCGAPPTRVGGRNHRSHPKEERLGLLHEETRLRPAWITSLEGSSPAWAVGAAVSGGWVGTQALQGDIPPPPLHPARGDTHKTRTSPARGCPAWGAHAGGTALGGGRGRGATSWLGDRGQPGRWRSQFTRGCSESQSREARGEFLGLRRVQKERVSGGSKGEKIKKSLKKKKESLHEDKGRCVPVPPQPLQAA